MSGSVKNIYRWDGKELLSLLHWDRKTSPHTEQRSGAVGEEHMRIGKPAIAGADQSDRKSGLA
jgi:hypothetical protein